MPTELHQDFGEKIGGAKKDLWRIRGLLVSDLEDMNQREAEKYTRKDYVWKKPDYPAMVDSGIPLGVVYFIKKVRDSVATAPEYTIWDDTPEKMLARQKEYIETVGKIKEYTEGVRTVQDVLSLYDRFFLENGYMERGFGEPIGRRYYLTAEGSRNRVLNYKLREAMRVSSSETFERDYTKEAQRQQFCVSKEQKIPRGMEIHFYDGKGYSRSGDWKAGTIMFPRVIPCCKTILPPVRRL